MVELVGGLRVVSLCSAATKTRNGLLLDLHLYPPRVHILADLLVSKPSEVQLDYPWMEAAPKEVT